MNLENYLTEQYPLDQQDISEVETTLDMAMKTIQFVAHFDAVHAWPYAVGQKSKGFSQNTTAMILNTLLRYRGHFNTVQKDFLIYKKSAFATTDALKKCPPENIKNGFTLLLQSVLPNGELGVNSGTYGINDIFTIAWISEVTSASLSNLNGTEKIQPSISEGLKSLVEKLQLTIKEKATRWREEGNAVLFSPTNNARAEEHSFPLLRFVQAALNLEALDDYSPYYAYFQSSLHEQLSFSSIPDSRFDPAELIFCFEGMMLCQPLSIDLTVFNRVLEVLTAAQSKSAFWRPVKPFMSTEQGMVLFPVSVEIANSILRCCVFIDQGKLHDSYGSKCVNLLRRYWQWLRARAVMNKGNQNISHLGWHSEHVNQTGTIHLWETSQVMDFLMSYRNMLREHVGRTTLVLSRVKQEKLSRDDWDKLQERYEPVSSLGEGLAAYKNIGTDFILKRSTGSDANYSMLLYGPPGTGKTTVAKSVAKSLGYRMITVTVSDFLASGGAQVESRAKNIFTMLECQPPCVVLFDEIDHFLLDRDSSRYAEQETLFQFMTPGMLTKIADLRETERVIFIIATNYEDRIDPAIKRTGRVDRKYLVLPPDAQKRLSIIISLLAEYSAFSVAEVAAFDTTQKQAISDKSLFLGFSDLKAVVQIYTTGGKKGVDTLCELLEERPRTISLEAYQSRFSPKIMDAEVPALRETPMPEFLALLGLRSELESEPPALGKKALGFARNVILSASGEPELNYAQIKKIDPFKMEESRLEKILTLFAAKS